MNESSIIKNRLIKNLKARKKWLIKQNIQAFRLYEKDIPEYPYIIDIYGEQAVIYEKGKKIPDNDTSLLEIQKYHQEEIISAISDVLEIKKNQIHMKRREKKEGKSQYEKKRERTEYFVIEEGPLKFNINLTKYLDTGLFLDHRPLREILLNSSQGKKVLNLFSYTGSLSVASAKGGGQTTTIDMSKTYLNWAIDNFKINSLSMDGHEFIQADICEYLKDSLQENYDIILLDPPSFSNSKRMEDDFNIQDDHEWMIEKLMQHLSPSGVLYFSNNFRKFKLSSKLLEDFHIKDITHQSIPKDFRDMKIHYCFKIQHKT